jgi:hypothetical protein
MLLYVKKVEKKPGINDFFSLIKYVEGKGGKGEERRNYNRINKTQGGWATQITAPKHREDDAESNK